MLPDFDEIKKNYARFSDQKLLKIATTQAADLRPEALEILKTELQKRGYPHNFLDGVEIQVQPLTAQKLDDLYHVVRSLPCPDCLSTKSPLNAVIIRQVISFYLTTQVKKTKIACPACLNKALQTALVKSALLGWWGGFGLIHTPQALYSNSRMKKLLQSDAPTDILQGLVVNYRGKIETYRNDKLKLMEFILAVHV